MADIVIVGKTMQYGMPPGQLFLTISHCRLRMLKRGLATSWSSIWYMWNSSSAALLTVQTRLMQV